MALSFDLDGTRWVGSLTLDSAAEFVRLSWSTNEAGTLDRPNRFEFEVPVYDVRRDGRELHFSAGRLFFEGRFEGALLAGTVRGYAENGAFRLEREHDISRAEYASVQGRYRLANGRQITLGMDDRDEGLLLFCEEGDRIVRMYPLGPQRFLSERLETLSFAASPVWQERGDPSRAMERVPWCTEEHVQVPVADYVLAGTLLLPPGDGPHPLVIMCHHANTHVRDYYSLFAEPFVEQGIAAFVYDKRGRGESTGTPLFSEIFKLADDAEAVFRFMQRHPAIRPDKIGFWGISNGAWVAPLAAERVGEAAFVIGASGSGVSPARQEQWRRANVARELGASPRAVALLERMWGSLFRFAVDGQWNDHVESLLGQVYADEELQNLPKHPDHAPGLQPVPPLQPIEQVRAEDGGAWPEGGFEVAPVYARLHCPVLCVWGAQDDVQPVEESLKRVGDAMRESGHVDYTLEVVESATHHLYAVPPPVSGILAEVMHTRMHNVTIAPGVRPLMAGWARERVSSG